MLKELELIAGKLIESHRILSRTLDGVTAEQAAQIKVTPDWTAKDVVAHLAGAERGMLGIARGMANGQNPQLPEGYNNDENNARMVGKRKDQTLAQVRAELDGIHADLLALLDSITPQQLVMMGEHPLAGEVTLKDLLVIMYSHETSHGNEISNKFREAKK